MLHPVDFAENIHHGVVYDNGKLGITVNGGKFCNGNMAAESDDLVADSMFKSQYNTYTYNHDCQTNRNTDGGNTYSRTTYFSFVALITVNALGYKKGKVQSIPKFYCSVLPG
jgi:hypothetical protein